MFSLTMVFMVGQRSKKIRRYKKKYAGYVLKEELLKNNVEKSLKNLIIGCPKRSLGGSETKFK